MVIEKVRSCILRFIFIQRIIIIKTDCEKEMQFKILVISSKLINRSIGGLLPSLIGSDDLSQIYECFKKSFTIKPT